MAESKTVPKTTLFCADAPNSFSPTRSTQSPSHMSDGSVKHIEARETTPQFPRSPQKSQEEDDNMRPKQLLSLMQSRTDPALSSPEQSSSSRPVDVDLMPTTPPRPPSVAPPKQKAEGGAPSGPPSPTIEGTHDGCYSTVRLGFGEEVVSSEGSIGTATEDDCSTRIEAVPTTQPADEDTRPPGTSDLDSNGDYDIVTSYLIYFQIPMLGMKKMVRLFTSGTALHYCIASDNWSSE